MHHNCCQNAHWAAKQNPFRNKHLQIRTNFETTVKVSNWWNYSKTLHIFHTFCILIEYKFYFEMKGKLNYINNLKWNMTFWFEIGGNRLCHAWTNVEASLSVYFVDMVWLFHCSLHGIQQRRWCRRARHKSSQVGILNSLKKRGASFQILFSAAIYQAICGRSKMQMSKLCTFHYHTMLNYQQP